MDRYEQEFTNDEPVNFNGLMIYPVKLNNWFKYNMCSSILDIDKNSIPDPKTISMSYLDFLIYIISSKDDKSNSFAYMLYEIFKMCTREDDIDLYYGKDENGKTFIKIKDVKINKKEFDELRDLILRQNVPGYKREYINPDLAKDLAEKERLQNNGKKSVSIEKQIVSVVIGSSLSLEEVLNLTIRKFYIILELIDKKLHYIMFKQASMSGMVEFKNEIEHYLSESDNSGIDDKIIDMESLKNKINA